ncbi:hypothetical protein D3C81_537230 [compost metagenome]
MSDNVKEICLKFDEILSNNPNFKLIVSRVCAFPHIDSYEVQDDDCSIISLYNGNTFIGSVIGSSLKFNRVTKLDVVGASYTIFLEVI